MTDTIKRLAGPTRPAQTNAGTLLYTAGASTVTAVKSALIHNTDPLMGAFFTMAIGSDLGVEAGLDDRILSNYYVAPGDTAYVPLDLVLGNNDTLYARQSCMIDPSEMTIAIAVASIGSTTDAAALASATWTEASGDLFLLTFWGKKATAVGDVSSFTDTHTGVTWTLLGTYVSADGNERISSYTAQSTGTTNTTTTVNTDYTWIDAALSITKITALTSLRDDATGTNGSTAFRWLGGGEAGTGATPLLTAKEMGAAVTYTVVHSTASEAHTAMTGWTEINDVSTTESIATAQMLAPASWARPGIATGTTRPMFAFAEILNNKRSLTVTLNGVEVT